MSSLILAPPLLARLPWRRRSARPPRLPCRRKRGSAWWWPDRADAYAAADGGLMSNRNPRGHPAVRGRANVTLPVVAAPSSRASGSGPPRRGLAARTSAPAPGRPRGLGSDRRCLDNARALSGVAWSDPVISMSPRPAAASARPELCSSIRRSWKPSRSSQTSPRWSRAT